MVKQRNNPNEIRTRLAGLLNEKTFVSGEFLAHELGLTRSSVSNHIKALNALGLDIYSVKGRGYQLAKAVDLLSQSRIQAELPEYPYLHAPKVMVDNIVGSTNDVVKQLGDELPQGSVCLAEAQTKGRGRRGKTWVSPFGASIYLSMIWRFDSGYQSMAGLSLLVGLAVNRALIRIGVKNCRLKWPNDIYHQNKKLAGILIEVEGQVGEQTTAIIGIGVNVNLPSTALLIDQAYTDIASALVQKVDRNRFAVCLIDSLWQMLPDFQQHGLSPFMSEWERADLFAGQEVRLISGQYENRGISRGIDSSGALLLEADGKIKAYHGGEISVRKA
jgi:BirA family biotin operon repressor/biotin-[acetyl-CoA-carboxylase] ligase